MYVGRHVFSYINENVSGMVWLAISQGHWTYVCEIVQTDQRYNDSITRSTAKLCAIYMVRRREKLSSLRHEAPTNFILYNIYLLWNYVYYRDSSCAFAVYMRVKVPKPISMSIYMLTMPRTNETNQPSLYHPQLRIKRVQHLNLITIYLADDCRSLYWLTMVTYWDSGDALTKQLWQWSSHIYSSFCPCTIH